MARLELAETEVDGFTVHCNCRYATPPFGAKDCWRKELNPQPSDYKSGALPIELLQQIGETFISNVSFLDQHLPFQRQYLHFLEMEDH